MRLAFVTAVLVALTACGTGLDGLVEDTGLEDEPTGPVRVTLIDPWWGPTAGGNVITVTGEGFTGSVVVKLGDVTAQTFRESTTTLLVTVPRANAEGPVEVVVEAQDGTARVSEGYWYSDHGPPDVDTDTDTNDDTDTDVTATGLVGGLVEFNLLQIACPECFGSATGLAVSADAAFHNPSPMGWFDWLPASGTCQVNPTRGGPTASRKDVGDWVYLQSGTASIPLSRTSGDGGLFYTAQGLDDGDFRFNGSFDVHVPGGGPFGPFTVQGGLENTDGFDAIAPVEMLYVAPEAAFSAAISQYGQTFQWAPYGGNGGFLVMIDVYDEYGSAYLGQIVCFGPDNGQMTVPMSFLSQGPAYGLVGIWMTRFKLTETLLPDGSTLQAVSQVSVLGTGTLVPW